MGQVWTRLGLSMYMALKRPAEIKIHISGAIRNGLTRDEMRELILHSFLYCGGPAAFDAYKTMCNELPIIAALIKNR